ncbi:MAG: histidine triad nucleotide-binding protein [Candidatus Nealsonbacteria bacterium CG08_land_8_20_14_0_20_43_11]|uniref:Histidine triad nucleotide-binding protein n=1 Tax=Candidatus Nealsonbacteria bacterium CG08_land_8_20_14_0_20_43_11 TaxID=1974706 RepID=A0A2M6SZV5_9BACT|nr:MAG: histidine triad nucleotide-binding protein [Candidatus Nealsonbacteria bacterium CG08_land_8_20_14_0_20_43_11]
MGECVFCKIANKELPAKIVFENENVLGFENIEPEAPVHLLFIPKNHLEWKDNLTGGNEAILSEMVVSAKKVAAEKKIDYAYKLIFNVGRTGHISHIHLHLLGGWQKEIPTHNI